MATIYVACFSPSQPYLYMNNQPESSIVVLAYNGLDEVTRPCVESILRNTESGSYELVLVDNASSDGTADYFEGLRAQYDHVTLCLNSENKGYAGGNNDGMRLARGGYIVLLNNDTLVPPGWLDRLLKLLKTNQNIGLVGPVTNSAGNEQRIEIPGLNELNFEDLATRYLERQHGEWFTTERLGFYCVAIKRQVMERVGLLDERFGLGMFEDDDYCIRVRKAGFALAVIEDCFVYHKGSVSFGKLSVNTYRDLFERNRTLFTKLHGVQWSFSDVALGYWEKFNKDLSSYRERVADDKIDPAIERLLVRWPNFHHLLVQVHRAELAGVQSKSKDSPAIKRAKWRIRWHNFNRNVVRGSWRERRQYVAHLSSRVLNRFLLASRPNGLHPEAQVLVDALPAPSDDQQVIIFPATIDYSYMTQRPQQLANAFAEAGYFVIYGTLNHVSDKVDVAEQVRENIYLVNERYFPHIPHLVCPEKSIYYCMWPNNVKHLGYLPYSRLLYDYMDELSLLDLPLEQLEYDHRTILDKADVVTVTASGLLEKIPSDYKYKAILVPNAVSDDFIDSLKHPTLIPDELLPISAKKIIGYYGAIAEWVDFELIRLIADSFPKCFIVLIGPVSASARNSVAEIETKNNIMILEERSQIELIPFLQRFDVCIVPFLKNSITDAVSPVKVYEYLAAQKPVVSTNLRESSSIPLIVNCSTSTAFINAIQCELNAKSKTARSIVAKNNTWKMRREQIDSFLSISVFDDVLISKVKNIQCLIHSAYSESESYYAKYYLENYSRDEILYWHPVLEWITCLKFVESVIDIGAAYGTLLMFSIEYHRPRHATLFDVVPYFPKRLIEERAIRRFKIDIERDSIPSDHFYDLIIFTEVIERLNYNPIPTLQKLWSMLRENGCIIVSTPDAASWGRTTKYYNALNEIPDYVQQSGDWIDDHIWQYTKEELDYLFCITGFVVEKFSYAPGVPGSGRHLCFLIRKVIPVEISHGEILESVCWSG